MEGNQTTLAENPKAWGGQEDCQWGGTQPKVRVEGNQWDGDTLNVGWKTISLPWLKKDQVKTASGVGRDLK